jgi:hypothetical protein
MSILSRPDFMDAVRKADELDVLPEFLHGVTRIVKRENRIRAQQRHNTQALEKLNRMRRARGMTEVTSL